MKKNLIVLFLVITGKLFFVDALTAQVTRLSATKIQVQNFCIQFTPGLVTVGINYFSAGTWTPDPTNVYTYSSVTATLSGSTATFEFAGSSAPNGTPAVNFPATLQQGNIKLNGMNFFWPGNNCTPLPILLNYFRASLTSGNQYAQCTWETSMEQNVDHWELQRSTDAVNFTTVVVEDAAGNSNITTDYSVIANVKAGQNYFRVLFFDGVTTLNNSPVVPINVPAGTYPTDVCGYQSITTGPNPLCPGAAGVYKLHNASPNTVWTVNPSSDPISSSNAGTVGHLTNTAYSTGYTGTTVLTTTSGGCVKNVQLLNAAPVSSITITGPTAICANGAFGLSSTTGISNISWASNLGSIANVSPTTGATTTLTRAPSQNGNIILSSSYFVSDPVSGCSFPVVKTKPVAVAAPAPVISVTLDCPDGSASASGAPGATTFTWHLVNTATLQETIYSNYGSSINFRGLQGTHNIGATYVNSCGTSPSTVVYNVFCPGSSGGHIVARPNPTTGLVKISLMDDVPLSTTQSTASTSTIKNNIYQIKVIDQTGTVKKVISYSGGVPSATVDVSNLTSGVYMIQVYNNLTWTSQQIIIAK